MPALFTTTSSRPKASRAEPTRRCGALPVGHVVAVDDGLAAGRHDVVDHLLRRGHRAARAVELGADVVDDDLRALAGELERVTAADAAPRAGDDDDAPLADTGHAGHDVIDLTGRQNARDVGIVVRIVDDTGSWRGDRTHMRYGVTMFVTDLSIGVVDLAQAAEERGLDSLWLPEHTHIPTSRHDPAPVGRSSCPRSTSGRSTRSSPSARSPAPRRRCGSAPASCCRPSATRSSPPRRWPRSTTCRAAGWRSASASAGTRTRSPTTASSSRDRRDVAREHVLAMQALWGDDEASFAGEHVRIPPSWSWPKPVQADAAGRPPRPRPGGRRRRAEAVRPRRRVRRRVGADRRRRAVVVAARPSGPPWPRRDAIPPRSRSSRSRPSPTTASSTTTTTWASPRRCSTCRRRPATRSCRSSTGSRPWWPSGARPDRRPAASRADRSARRRGRRGTLSTR